VPLIAAHLFRASCCLLVLGLFSFCGAAQEDPFEVIRAIPSYFDLSVAPGLKSYEVPAQGRGAAWQEIAASLGLKEVELVEYFHAPDQVCLRLRAKGMGSTQFVPGLFDPNQAVGLLLDELRLLKEKKTLGTLRDRGVVSSMVSNGRRRISLTPRDGLLLEQFRESGTEAALIRIYAIEAELDSASDRLLRLVLDKETMIRSVGAPVSSESGRVKLRLDLAYERFDARWLPKELVH